MADLLQILKGTGAKPRITFYANGVASDLDSGVPVVTITKPDLTTIASGTVSKPASTIGVYEFTLGAQAECTLLTVTWAGPIGGVTETLTTFVEVVGAHLFTLAAAKAFDGGAIVATTNAPVPTDTDILDARARITDDFAEILGFQPVPRFAREVLDGDGDTCLGLRYLKAHRILSVTVNGIAQTASNYQINKGNEIEAVSSYGYGTAFTWGRRNVAVEYVAGDQQVDPATSRAALIVAKSQLVRSDVTDRATSLAGPEGGTTFLSTAGRESGGAIQWYGLPLVDSCLNRRSQRGLAVA